MDVIGTIIPCYNRRDVTLMCLDRLQHIQRSGFEHRIYVVDDGSTDGTGDAVRAKFAGEIRVIEGTGCLFWTGAINRGIEYAVRETCDYIHLMNDDVSFPDDFLLHLYRTTKANGASSVVGSVTCDIENRERVLRAGVLWDPWKVSPWTVVGECSLMSLVEQGVIRVDSLSGRSVLLPASLVLENGYLDERRFPHSFGDLDYFLRAKTRGYAILVDPKSVVYTRLEDKLVERFIVRGKVKGILDFWFNVNYFGVQTAWHMSRYTKKRVRYLLTDVLRKCWITALRVCVSDQEFRKRVGTIDK